MIQDLTPIIYEHLCISNELNVPVPLECLTNVEDFLGEAILPEKPYTFYLSGEFVSDNIVVSETDASYDQQVQEILAQATSGWIADLISTKLDDSIQIGIKKQNYI